MPQDNPVLRLDGLDPTPHNPAMTPCRIASSIALVSTLASPCLGAPQSAFSDKLQQEAMSCVGEAMQICPEVLTAEDHGVGCMVGKRSQFSPRCRVIYDHVARVLKR